MSTISNATLQKRHTDSTLINIHDIIVQYVTATGKPPSIKRLAERMQLNDSQIHHALAELEARGYLLYHQDCPVDVQPIIVLREELDCDLFACEGVYAFIIRWMDKHHTPPTVRQIRQHLRLPMFYVYQALKKLDRRGYLDFRIVPQPEISVQRVAPFTAPVETMEITIASSDEIDTKPDESAPYALELANIRDTNFTITLLPGVVEAETEPARPADFDERLAEYLKLRGRNGKS